ncbi:MaoC/PaaZ C-terminal domain-containing protein [Shewanella sp. YIC-542]|uniref:MaoC/PaaZ C-terminal domain-containing protein n=1 Tax=Shewanella mytili TaxID=3377111 RepID=UPI00398EBE95
MPSLFSLYRKIFFGRKPGWDQQPLPRLQVSARQIQLSPLKVAEYAEVCGFAFDGRMLPPTYLYVAAFRLHATIFTHEAITFPLIGLIHLRNQIRCYRAVALYEWLDIDCAITDSRETDSGLEFELVSKVYNGDELVWEAVSTYLYRIDKPGRRTRPPKASEMDWQAPVFWSLGEDLGRRYARASGDYNLIHLHPLLSKRFGFDRILVHGMWSKARCLAELMPQIAQRPFAIDVTFKLPLFMPANVSFNAQSMAQGICFELRDQKGRRPHLTGNITFLE